LKQQNLLQKHLRILLDKNKYNLLKNNCLNICICHLFFVTLQIEKENKMQAFFLIAFEVNSSAKSPKEI